MTEPTRRDRLKPFELVLISAGLALFGGLIVWLSSRDIKFAGIAFAVSFIVFLVLLAMFVLSMKPNKDEIIDLAQQDENSAH